MPSNDECCFGLIAFGGIGVKGDFLSTAGGWYLAKVLFTHSYVCGGIRIY